MAPHSCREVLFPLHLARNLHSDLPIGYLFESKSEKKGVQPPAGGLSLRSPRTTEYSG